MSGVASFLYAQPSIAIHVGLVLGLPQVPSLKKLNSLT